MKLRVVAAAAVVAGVVLAGQGHAAAPFVIDDAKGDAVAGTQASLDLVRITYATTGKSTTTKVRGKNVTQYTPSALVVTMTLAGAPRTEAGFRYKVNSEVDGCGFFNVAYAPGTAFATIVGPGTAFLGCGSPPDETGSRATLLSPSTKVKGNDIIWTLPLKSLPKEVRAGAKLHDVVAYSDIVEPVLGSDGPSDAGVPTVFDTASSSKTWIIR